MQGRWSSVIRGVAYGDSIAYPNEFTSYRELTRDNPRGPEFPEQFIVSDDTQLTLHLARALDAARVATLSTGVLDIESHVIDEWVKWYDHPDNDRAPGMNCLKACAALAQGDRWQHATSVTADTCGAVMRVAPCAFLPTGLWLPVSMWQAASTHGAPAAIASALILTAVLRSAMREDTVPGGTLHKAIRMTQQMAPISFVGDWLTQHPLAGTQESAAAMVSLGLTSVRKSLTDALALLPQFRLSPWAGDPSETLPGWKATEALAAALLCVDMFPDQPLEALRRASVTDGDSDTIAAIAGAVLGALHDDPWPKEWDDRLEPRYRDWIAETEHYSYDFEKVMT